VSRKLLIVLFAFVVVGTLVFAAGGLASPATGLPVAVTPATPCPVAGCTQVDGGCHAAGPAPVPDGSFEMVCPHVIGCSDAGCHAWDRIESASLRSRPSDASLNLWIIVPVVLVVGLVALVRKL
jgi:hypothetical protein